MDTNDPRLTAYALGELDDNERAEVETALSQSDELRETVEQIRETTALLETSLAAEPAPQLTDEQRQLIHRKAETMTSPHINPKNVSFSFVRRHWLITSAAATVALAFGATYYLIPELPKNRTLTKRPSILAYPRVDNGLAGKKEGRTDSPTSAELNEADLLAKDRSAVVIESTVASSRISSEKPNAVFKVGRSLGNRGRRDGKWRQAKTVARARRALDSLAAVPPGQHVRVSTDDYAITNPFGSVLDARVPVGGGSNRTRTLSETEITRLKSLGYVSANLLRGRSGSSKRVIGLAPGGGGVFRGGFGRGSAPDGGDGRYYDYDGERGVDVDTSAESYDHITENPFRLVTSNPLSTFSIDVDTASYANVRRILNSGSLPPAGAVRIEEMINYFTYEYPQPVGEDPFSVNVEIAECPWQPDHRLVRIGLKGYEVTAEDRPPANLVFLIDVSGSMRSPNKLTLLKAAMKMLVNQLTPDDDVAIVVYAGASGIVLPSTSCGSPGAIIAALDNLQAGGSTNGGAGIQLAYQLAMDNFIPGGANRVILATDGDFNVGVTSRDELIRLIEENAKSGVFLSVLGFGMGNLQDSTLEQLADKGNGNYAYIDTLQEARKVLVDQIGGTLVTIAKDVKIQVEFNPAEVEAYRLIGYENRILAAQDFNDDKKDAGEIGAGHTVTALYEIVPAGVAIDVPTVDPLKYQTEHSPSSESTSGEMMTVKLRYKEPNGDTSKLVELPVADTGMTLAESSDDFAFAAAVAGFGMLLRRSTHAGDLTYGAVSELAVGALSDDPNGYRAEFLQLVDLAGELSTPRP